MASPSTAITLQPPPPAVYPAAVQQSLHHKLPAPLQCAPGLPPSLPAVPRPLHPLGLQAMDLQRSQMLDLRFRYSLALQHTASAGLAAIGGLPGMPPMHQGAPLHDPAVMAAYLYSKNMDPRARFFQEEPKPSQSYIGLIAMALLSSTDEKLVLGDIYQWILDNYPYFRNRGPGWRNSIRHNLSLNDCFIKAGRAANGKGHYWAIHPANTDDFKRGDFRRRRAQRKVRKAMGLDVPDEEDSPSPPPGPEGSLTWRDRMLQDPAHRPRYPQPLNDSPPQPREAKAAKRGFDMASLLAPEKDTSIDSMNDSGIVAPGSSERDLAVNKSDASSKQEDEDDEYIDVDSTGEEDEDRRLVVQGVKRKLELDNTDDSITSTPKQQRLNTSDDHLDSSPEQADPRPQGSFLPRTEAPTNVSAWPRPVCPPIWTPGQPSAFYPNPFLAWGGLQGLPIHPAMYPPGLRDGRLIHGQAQEGEAEGAVSPHSEGEQVKGEEEEGRDSAEGEEAGRG